MNIAVYGDDDLVSIFKASKFSALPQWIEIGDTSNKPNAIFFLSEQLPQWEVSSDIPCFWGTLLHQLTELDHQEGVVRFNAWPGFIEGTHWEIAGDITDSHQAVLNFLGKQAITVQDVVGLASPRVISMIINEAFLAKDDEVSSSKEIDIAMKLGTNYPYGPFEWVEKIGAHRVYALLNKLQQHDIRYAPSPALVNNFTA